ncbi:hypothetical protein FRC07_002924 [Ceratobasidium sp. 392]|nr:hypothetical protein FRC07_002924 [Ceratobasidium sp. 392]
MPGPCVPLQCKKNKNLIKSTGNDFSWRQFTREDSDNLNIPQLMCEKFGWEEAQPFQVSATRAQLVGKNVLAHASTGRTEGEVTLFVAPLLLLHTEMTKTFEEKYHLSTIAVNSLIQGGTKQIFKDIVNGKYQIVILAPEMLLHQRFVDAVMKSQRFRQHLCFRKSYASQSAKYQSDAMAAFATGAIRILVCTEAAGMGCDIPGVKIVAQWKTPKTTPDAVQRGGRPAQNPKEEGIYIQFNRPASFRINPTAPPKLKPKKPQNSGEKRDKHKKNKVSPETQPATETSSTKPADFRFKSDVRAEPEINEDSPGKGIYCFVQTKQYCRRVWDKKSSRAPRITKYEVSQQTAEALKEWCNTTFESDYPTANYDSDGFMDDELVESLLSVNPMISLETLTASFCRQWEHWDKYKDRIYAIVLVKNTRQNNQILNPPSKLLEFSTDLNLGKIQGECPAKHPWLSALTQPSKQLAVRKQKLSEHKTKLDWGVQAQAPPEESQTNDTQSYSQSVFLQSRPPTPSLSRVQPSIHPASVGYSSNAQAKASHQRFTRPLSVSLDDQGYRQTNTPFVPLQSRYRTPVPRLQQSLPTQVCYQPYTLPNVPNADLYAHQSLSGQLAPVPAHVVPPPQYHAGNSQQYHASNIKQYSQTAFEYPSGFDRITPPHEPLHFAYATAYSPDPPRQPQTGSQLAHSHLDYWNC